MDTAVKIVEGNVKAASRLIRDIEDNITSVTTTIKKIYPYTGQAHVIGITGAPGAGKSTLTNGLIASFRKLGKTVGVLAVDPTSPFTGGALLGDRVRMQRHSLDEGVFIRSLATRGALGGLSRAVGDSISIMDGMGKDIVIVETVGVGQQEVDIMNHAHTVMLVLVPGMGDSVQTIKAGIMEIADIYVINKADRSGADMLFQEINLMLDMAFEQRGGWRPPVNKVGNINEEKTFNQDTDKVVDNLIKHMEYLKTSGLLEGLERRKAGYQLKSALAACVLEPLFRNLQEKGLYEEMIQKIITKVQDPHSMAEEIATRCLMSSQFD